MASPRYPSLYQVNTRVYLTELGRRLGRPATLADIPDGMLDQVRDQGFDWIWWLSVWTTSPRSRQVSLTNSDWRREFEETLPDLTDDDIGGSGFAIEAYDVSPQLGGDEALADLRGRMRKRGLSLMLDFVPNHSGLDHRYLEESPEFYIAGTEEEVARSPGNYFRVALPGGPEFVALGRDPNYPAWPDVLQFNYGVAGLQKSLTNELLRIAERCDGVRCDMAMLMLPEIFQRTWGITPPSFWPEATAAVRRAHPGFRFLAEVYWDLEWRLQQQGFDWTYDKRLYDRLRHGDATGLRGHLGAGLDFQDRLARFLENHDEARAAASFPDDQHRAAAAITYLSPGLRFFYDGQFEGRLVRVSPHLVRAPAESVSSSLSEFYERLRSVLKRDVVRDGNWQLLDCSPAWDGNGTHNAFVTMAWTNGDQRLLVAVNDSADQAQCYCRLPWAGLARHRVRLTDLLGNATYERDGAELLDRGLYLDVLPWTAHAFDVAVEE